MLPKRKTISAVNTILRYLDNYSREDRRTILADIQEVMDKDPTEFKVVRASHARNPNGIRLRPENEVPRKSLGRKPIGTHRMEVDPDKEEEQEEETKVIETPMEKDLRLLKEKNAGKPGLSILLRLPKYSLEEQAPLMKDGWRIPLTKQERKNLAHNLKWYAKVHGYTKMEMSKQSKKHKCYISANGFMYLMMDNPKYNNTTWRLIKSSAKLLNMTVDEVVSEP